MFVGYFGWMFLIWGAFGFGSGGKNVFRFGFGLGSVKVVKELA